MLRTLFTLLLSAHLLLPVTAWAEVKLKDPLDYSLKTYGFILATALFGGMVSWYAKVRRGELPLWSISSLVGELATSAFGGLLCFWICEAAGVSPLITAALTGVAGHMGARAITLLEEWGAKRAQRMLG